MKKDDACSLKSKLSNAVCCVPNRRGREELSRIMFTLSWSLRLKGTNQD